MENREEFWATAVPERTTPNEAMRRIILQDFVRSRLLFVIDLCGLRSDLPGTVFSRLI